MTFGLDHSANCCIIYNIMFRGKIAQAMQENNWSLSQLANKSGVDKGNLSRFLRGGNAIGVQKAERLLKTLSLSIQTEDARPNWEKQADLDFARLKPVLREVPLEDLHLIVYSLAMPLRFKHFLIKEHDFGKSI